MARDKDVFWSLCSSTGRLRPEIRKRSGKFGDLEPFGIESGGQRGTGKLRDWGWEKLAGANGPVEKYTIKNDGVTTSNRLVIDRLNYTKSVTEFLTILAPSLSVENATGSRNGEEYLCKVPKSTLF